MPRAAARQAALAEHKRALILDAAWAVFAREGLDGASLRAIAREAGYTAGAIYFHFDSKEAIYAALLARSLQALDARTRAAAAAAEPGRVLRASAEAFFDFYAEHPRDLDLGFYLSRGGLRPHGLGRERDRELNAALLAALEPLRAALLQAGLDAAGADAETAALFAHATGLLLLQQTGRIRLFGAGARALLAGYLDDLERRLPGAVAR
ncbi:MAG TPA: helix-turn-helix domain-containing protein [Gammaproteobacteria bacterium]